MDRKNSKARNTAIGPLYERYITSDQYTEGSHADMSKKDKKTMGMKKHSQLISLPVMIMKLF